ncbi:MAG TPA: macro domain-containing protein [Spirochaetota bacterium]|nr:macro domain-containing protein [Spirochaetota bacterium]
MEMISVIRGNIIDQNVDIILNPINADIIFTKGIPLYIKKEGGEIIEKEALKYYPGTLGSYFITTAGKLKAKYILHFINSEFAKTVNYKILKEGLTSALESIFNLDVSSIAIPPIYDKFSQYITAKIIKEAIYDAFIKKNKNYTVKIVVYDENATEIFKKVIESSGENIVQ